MREVYANELAGESTPEQRGEDLALVGCLILQQQVSMQCTTAAAASPHCCVLLTKLFKPHTCLQVAVESWNFPDRKNTVTGHAINEYLAGKQDHNDRAIHLLFSANRWEKRQAAAAMQHIAAAAVDTSVSPTLYLLLGS